MTSRNDVTGDKIQTKPTTKEYADNYDKIFGKKKELPPACDNYGRCNCTNNKCYISKEEQQR